MKSPVLYLLEVLFCSGLFLVVYRLLLVRRVSFRICRRYLVVATLLAVSLPLLNVPLYPAETVYYNRLPSVEMVIEEPAVTENISIVEKAVSPIANIDWRDVARVALLCLYVVVAGVSFLIFANRVRAICRLRRASTLTHCLKYDLAENDAVKSPFSFLRTIYIGNDYSGREREQIICHESWHVSHRHSIERITMEVVRCLFWFNPFVWIACRELTEVQEWEADREVLRNGYDVKEYRTVIFRQLFGYNPDIICGLNNSLTKNRFIMMTHFNESKFTLLRLGAIAVIVVGMMMLCSFTTKSPCVVATSDSTSMTLKPDLSDAHAPLVCSTDKNDSKNCRINVKKDAFYVDGIATPLSDLGRVIRPDMTVIISVDKDEPVSMGRITDLKQALRKIDALRVSYEVAGVKPVSRLLPPLPSKDNKVKTVVLTEVIQVVANDKTATSVKDLSTTKRITARNVLMILISNDGTIMTLPNEKVVDIGHLKELVKTFVLNPSNSENMAEKESVGVELADGSKWTYPQSKGLVSLQTSMGTDYQAYVRVQNELVAAYDEIRNDVSMRKFGRPMSELSDAERQAVMKAEPMKIAEAEPRRLSAIKK